MNNFKLVILLTVLVSSINCQNSLRTITSYMNCKQQWANQVMTGDKTLCTNGSLVSCLAMLLQYSSLTINSLAANPLLTNQYIKAHNGYTNDSREVDFQIFEQKGLQMVLTTSDLKVMRDYFDKGYNVILNFDFGKNYGVLLGYNLVQGEYQYVFNNPQDVKKRTAKQPEITVGIIFTDNKKK